MKPNMKFAATVFLAIVLIFTGMTIFIGICQATEEADDASLEPLPEINKPSDAEKILAPLSDEQVRRMLLTELQRELVPQVPSETEQMRGPAAVFDTLLKVFSSEHDENEDRFRHLWSSLPQILPDLNRTFSKLSPYGTYSGAVKNVFWVAFFIFIGFIIEQLLRKFFIQKYYSATVDTDLDQMSHADKLSAGIAQIFPDLLGLIFFFAAAYFSFSFFIWTDSSNVQTFFLAILIGISIIRLIATLSRLLFSPDAPSFRVLPLDSGTARTAHRLLVWTTGYIVSVLLLSVVLLRLGAERETILLSQLFFATVLLAATAAAVILFRKNIQDRIITAVEEDNQRLTWSRRQLASIWHILALTYLFILWFLLLNDITNPDTRSGGAFILSFFVVPVWVVADRVTQWFVKYAVSNLKIHQEIYDDSTPPSQEALKERRKGKELYLKAKGAARIGVVGVLIIWVANLWNIRIPFFSELAAVLLDALIILTVALFFWQFISSWIERKIKDSVPQAEDKTEEDSEWGAAATRGRTYTLLPILRKFIGSILVVMVTLTIISSLGVDIGPLLAGAGVVGLALGFGAQKLVSDMFSGFFYLLDDAFRVGEYIQAGSVSGAVESISLRNVMLRHHRGMLQIIPHSELGAITNFMRGGIIVKFNLDFPYDAPIDQIRKIIKKVGKKMLEDEEFSSDFIKPLKSQGVREITNSVMTIRVKFTAQPGTHFVIRREAYRLITEALNAKGIYYAHRKVIVDLPEDVKESLEGKPEVKKQITEMAGAAAIRTIEEEEKEQSENDAEK